MIYAPIDIAFLLLAIILIIRCGLHGFIEEFMRLTWFFAGLLFSVSFFKKGAEIIREQFLPDIKILPEVLSFIALFLIVFIIIKIITAIFLDIIRRVKLKPVDHVLGLILGAIESLVVIGVVIFVINIQPLFDKDSVLSNSIFFNLIYSIDVHSHVADVLTKNQI
ncbi:MAG: hypothetical protein Ta2F_01630 [Termitinemataceae bacterium]|nr:MAG: hypothetical protein Ta2F_01630 [Termitinemataceae bacterium]